MAASRSTFKQHQILLALVLFLVGQVALALHSHNPSLHTVDAEECVICLLASSDNPASVPETPDFSFSAQNTQPLPAPKVLAVQTKQTPSQPRAPPFS